jgi:hypothetical protein
LVRSFCLGCQRVRSGIGKDNFYLIGEITGGGRAFNPGGDRLDAALAIDEIPDKMEFLIKDTVIRRLL